MHGTREAMWIAAKALLAVLGIYAGASQAFGHLDGPALFAAWVAAVVLAAVVALAIIVTSVEHPDGW